MECFRLLLEHLAWIEHQFLSGIRGSRKVGSLWGMMRGVGGVRKLIDQNGLAKGLGLLCWGFKGVQEEIPREEASTLQIGSVAFPIGQYTSPQFHPCRRLFDTRGLPRGLPEVFGTVQQGHCSRRGLKFHALLSIKVPIWKKSWNLLNDHRKKFF